MKKKLMFLLLLLCLFKYSFSQELDKRVFISDYDEKVSEIIQKYNAKKDYPLGARIFDIDNVNYLKFLTSSNGWKKSSTDKLAMMYFDSFKINEKKSSFCFILFDSNSKFVESYLKINSNYEDVLDYLVLHEMGHCIYSHQYQIQKIQEKLNEREGEQFADMFAIANFVSKSNQTAAKKVYEMNASVNKSDFHYNPEVLMSFYNKLIKKDIVIKNTDDLFNVAFSIFLEIKTNIN